MVQCTVMGCETGKNVQRKKIKEAGLQQLSVFRVPKNADELKTWSNAVGQHLKENDRVCQLHFSPSFIKTEDTYIENGKIFTIPCLTRQLRKGAVPLQTKNCITNEQHCSKVSSFKSIGSQVTSENLTNKLQEQKGTHNAQDSKISTEVSESLHTSEVFELQEENIEAMGIIFGLDNHESFKSAVDIPDAIKEEYIIINPESIDMIYCIEKESFEPVANNLDAVKEEEEEKDVIKKSESMDINSALSVTNMLDAVKEEDSIDYNFENKPSTSNLRIDDTLLHYSSNCKVLVQRIDTDPRYREQYLNACNRRLQRCSEVIQQNSNLYATGGASQPEKDENWEAPDDDVQTIECLFCIDTFNNFIDALKHLQATHNFSFARLKSKHALDVYSYIKLIKFIRKEKTSSDELNALSVKIWETNEYLTPANDDDPWLMCDIDELGELEINSNSYSIIHSKEDVILSETDFAELQKTSQSLIAQLEQRDVGAKFAMRHEILTDKVRVESFRDALLTNSHIFKGCVMLDVGCRIGILSMFAARSGCKQVIGVDQSDIIHNAINIVRENSLTDIVNLKKGRLEDINLEVEKVDAVVSDWMGYFLLLGGMLDSVIYAREHYLKPGGKLLPNRCTISLVGSGDTERYIDWSNVYGFKMNCMKTEVVQKPSIEVVEDKDLVTSVAEVQSFDLHSVTTDCVNFSAPFSLKVNRSGCLTSIIGYFDVFFDLDNPVSFSTGPYAAPTHWKQTVFPLNEPISVTEGEIVMGALICQRHAMDVQGLIVTIHLKDSKQVYVLD